MEVDEGTRKATKRTPYLLFKLMEKSVHTIPKISVRRTHIAPGYVSNRKAAAVILKWNILYAARVVGEYVDQDTRLMKDSTW